MVDLLVMIRRSSQENEILMISQRSGKYMHQNISVLLYIYWSFFLSLFVWMTLMNLRIDDTTYLRSFKDSFYLSRVDRMILPEDIRRDDSRKNFTISNVNKGRWDRVTEDSCTTTILRDGRNEKRNIVTDTIERRLPFEYRRRATTLTIFCRLESLTWALNRDAIWRDSRPFSAAGSHFMCQ